MPPSWPPPPGSGRAAAPAAGHPGPVGPVCGPAGPGAHPRRRGRPRPGPRTPRSCRPTPGRRRAWPLTTDRRRPGRGRSARLDPRGGLGGWGLAGSASAPSCWCCWLVVVAFGVYVDTTLTRVSVPAGGRDVGRHELADRRLGQPQQPDRRAEGRAGHRRRDVRAHRHDHAAAHRQRADDAGQHPARLRASRSPGTAATRSTPPTGGAVAPRRGPGAAGPHRRERHRPAHRPLRSRSASSACLGAVDAVGGVDMCVPESIKDPKAALNIKAGCQELWTAPPRWATSAPGPPRARTSTGWSGSGRSSPRWCTRRRSPSTLLNPFRRGAAGHRGSPARSPSTAATTSGTWPALGLAMRGLSAGDGVTTTVPVGHATVGGHPW